MKLRKLSAKKAYFICFVILSSIYIINGIKNFGPPMKAVSYQLSYDIQKEFPKNLEVVVSDGEIYSNFSFPIIIKTPATLQPYFTRNLFVIDPDGQEDMLTDYDALILINSYGITTLTSLGYQSFPMNKVPTIVINEASAKQFAEKLTKFGDKANLIVGSYFLAQSLYKFLVIYPLYLLIMTILGFFIIHKNIKGFKNRLRLCTITFIPMLVIASFLQYIKIKVTLFPWFSITHALVIIYVSYKITKNNQSALESKAN